MVDLSVLVAANPGRRVDVNVHTNDGVTRPIRAHEFFLAARFADRFEQWGLRLISSIKCALSSLGAEFFAS